MVEVVLSTFRSGVWPPRTWCGAGAPRWASCLGNA